MASDPYEDSRRLTGCNVHFPGSGAALEAAPGVAFDSGTLQRWQDHVADARAALGWPQDGERVIRRHRSGVSLAMAAPADQLYAATEVNEWAWESALLQGLGGQSPGPGVACGPDLPWDPLHAPGHALAVDAQRASDTLRRVAAAEATPALVALMQAASSRGLPWAVDDDEFTLGQGKGAHTWFNDELPEPAQVPWERLHAIPTALVTGSNGKTTTVRLLAEMCRAHGWHTAHSCTDGVYFEGVALETGDFSGPTGARTALRQGGADAAILETARGGMLRRGLAVCTANVAIVTNISADHFGEYGVHDLDDLAAVKLTVARAIGAEGLLVLNGDDPSLVSRAPLLECPLGWFALDFDQPLLSAQREAGRPTCGVRDGVLMLHAAGQAHALGRTVDMPLTLGDRAAYNIANLAGAALVGSALGIDAATITEVLAVFGRAPGDNPGRLQRWQLGGLEVFVDYAHNPDGLQGLLHAVGAMGRSGRLGMVLGHAGNREDADLRAVASTAAAARPERVLLKDIAGYERGREAGEVAAIMHAQLLEDGVAAAAIEICLEEVQAARGLLAWARGGDLVILPIHEMDAREQVIDLLDHLAASAWRPGSPLPPPTVPATP